jgi:PAS domain S-box-containing protein
MNIDKILAFLLFIASSGLVAIWLFDQPLLLTISSNSIVIAFNTVFLFLVAATGLLCQDLLPNRNLTKIFGIVLIVMSAIILGQDITGQDFGIDQFLVKQTVVDLSPHPNRLAPQTAVCFILCGLIFLLFGSGKSLSHIVIQFITISIMLLGVVGLAGSSLRLDLMFDWYKYSRMAIPTASGFILLAAALWARWYRDESLLGAYLEHPEKRISVTGIVIILTLGLASGLFGASVLAHQLEITLNRSLQDTYSNLQTLIVNEIDQKVLSAQPVTTRLLLNEYLDLYNRKINEAEDRQIVMRDIVSFAGSGFSAIAIYGLDNQLVASSGNFTIKSDLSIPLLSGRPDTTLTLLWLNGAHLRVRMSIFDDGKKLGSAVVETVLPYMDKIVAKKSILGDTAETRICSAINDTTMQCLPSLFQPQPFRNASRQLKGYEPIAMDYALKGQTGTRIAHDYRLHQVATAYGPVEPYGLGMVIKIDTSEFYAPIRQRLEWVLGFLGILSLIAIFTQRIQLVPLVARILISEREALANNKRVNAVMESVSEGILTIDHHATIRSTNSSVSRMFGYKKEEMIGNSFDMFAAASSRIAMQQLINNLTPDLDCHDERASYEIAVLDTGGKEFDVWASLSGLNLEGTKYFIVSMRDITEHKRLEKLKSEFISTVSHELRTPLTSIRGSLGLITAGVAGTLPVKAEGLIRIAHKNCDRLILLINDILDIEKVESGQMTFQLETLSLAPIIQQAIELNAPYAEKFQVFYNLVSPIPDIQVSVDVTRLIQVISNLLSNAAKFSPAGSTVTISAKISYGKVRVTVKDLGPGIPEEFRPRIFSKFAQADSSDTKQKSGTGLGLNIAKSMIENMGGIIGFESSMEIGTEFFFCLPIVH